MSNSAVDLPQIAPVHQALTTEQIHDIAGHVQAQLAGLPLNAAIRPGMRVAIGLGSRGISCLRAVVEPLVEALRAAGAEPFFVPAMGSHGGGTAEGQRDVLLGYGLGELGVPIYSDMEPVQVGATDAGMPLYTDANAAQADAIILVNRIKPHTAFRNRWESGLCKMLAIGLGKAQGAATIHGWGLRDAMPAAAQVLLSKLPVVAGIGIVENGHHQPAIINVLPGHALMEQEPALLEAAWQHLPRIPLEPLDLLVLQEIGKDISGTGMDLNVVGMWRRTGGPPQPDFRVIAALDLTSNSHGNAVGVGYCDLIPKRLADKVDLPATYTNCLTAGNFNGGKLPITLETDEAVISTALPSAHPAQARVVIAQNTLELGLLWVSTALLDEIEKHPNLTQAGDPAPIQFDGNGALRLPSLAPAAA